MGALSLKTPEPALCSRYNLTVLKPRMKHEAALIADRLRPLVQPGTAAYHVLAALGAARTDAEYAITATLLVRLLCEEER